MSLSVITLDGQALTWKKCVARELFRCYVDIFFLCIPGLVSILATRYKQRVGDLATHTQVVYSPRLEEAKACVYLTQDQYEVRKGKYQVGVLKRDEAQVFAASIFPLLLGSQQIPEGSLEYFQQSVTLLDSNFVDDDLTKLRFLGEYFLRLERETV